MSFWKARSIPGRSTFTATSAPDSASLARCTCAIEAAATGSEKALNTSSTVRPVSWAKAAFASALIGLLVSFHAGLPSGPVIVLCASLFFLGSLLFGSRASIRARLSHPMHLRG